MKQRTDDEIEINDIEPNNKFMRRFSSDQV